jgi:hypothetical protein
MLGDLFVLVGFVPPRVEADQASKQHRQKQLSANSLDDGKPARDIAARYYIAVAERCQCNETKIDWTGGGEIASRFAWTL